MHKTTNINKTKVKIIQVKTKTNFKFNQTNFL